MRKHLLLAALVESAPEMATNAPAPVAGFFRAAFRIAVTSSSRLTLIERQLDAPTARARAV
jgi:hypothetical protein